jgi:hypothetical protein
MVRWLKWTKKAFMLDGISKDSLVWLLWLEGQSQATFPGLLAYRLVAAAEESSKVASTFLP